MSASSSDMVVKAQSGALVRMEDIANVDLARAELDLERHDERPARRVHRHPGDADGQPAVASSQGVRALLPEIERNLPPSVKMQVAYDSTKFIQASIDEVEILARLRRWSSSLS